MTLSHSVKAFTQPNLIDRTSDKEGTPATDHKGTSKGQALSRGDSTFALEVGQS